MKKDKIYAHSDMQDPWPSFLLDWNKYGFVENVENWLWESEVCNFQVYIRSKNFSLGSSLAFNLKEGPTLRSLIQGEALI